MNDKKGRVSVRVKRFVNRFLCLLFWHRIDMNDSGYGVCGRCDAHEYYNSASTNEPDFPNTWDDAGYLVKPFWNIKQSWQIWKSLEWPRIKAKLKGEDYLPF